MTYHNVQKNLVLCDAFIDVEERVITPRTLVAPYPYEDLGPRGTSALAVKTLGETLHSFYCT